ncbi:hypothetical protein FAM09_13530 [Niastella caeni]|uniref:Uncharacterized protein n=1 Tax=Niastella caeni TaxID=2569763 RepID=A0A4S8HVA2_9BACT|nr:hypothetical protein [Niastella caeni]THU39520.1 hypothetical protein FAM09_13530 [Niastella caeni]
MKAQTPLFGTMNGIQPAFRHFHQVADSNNLRKKWFITKYAGISSGFIAFNGGSGTFLSAPVGVLINRQLNNNLYAFAGISAAPAFFHFNSAFYQPGINKNNSFMNANNFDVNPAAYMGLMYINNERTFSISGSIGVSRSSYYGYSPFYAPGNSPVFRNSRQ